MWCKYFIRPQQPKAKPSAAKPSLGRINGVCVCGGGARLQAIEFGGSSPQNRQHGKTGATTFGPWILLLGVALHTQLSLVYSWHPLNSLWRMFRATPFFAEK